MITHWKVGIHVWREIIATNHQGVPADSLRQIRPTHLPIQLCQIHLTEIPPWHLAFKSATTYWKLADNVLFQTLQYWHTSFIWELYLEEICQFQTWKLNLNRLTMSGSSGCNSYHPLSSTSTAKSAGSGRCCMNINNSCWWSAREGRRRGGSGRGGMVEKV